MKGYFLMTVSDSKRKSINGACQSIFSTTSFDPSPMTCGQSMNRAGHVTGYLSFQEIQWQCGY